MEIVFDKQYLEDLYLNGKTSDKKHRFQPNVVAKYRKTIDLLESVVKVLKWAFWAVLFVSVLLVIKQVLKPDDVSGAVEALEAEGEGSRNWEYAGLGVTVLKYMFSKYSMLGIVLSPWKFGVIIISCGMFLISGFRNIVLQCISFVLCVSYFQRQLMLFVLMAFTAWGGVVLLSQVGVLHFMPYAVQRSMASIPGVTVGSWAEEGAEGSLEWRYEMWEYGLNPREGYIKDYVWGDGFAIHASFYSRNFYLKSVRKLNVKHNRLFAEQGMWHAGWLVAIHRTGYVGLVVLTLWFSLFLCITFRVSKAINNIVGKEYIYMIALTFPGEVIIGFYWSAGTWTKVFINCFYQAAIIKLIYALARDEGMMKPMFQRKRYVPLMVEANESQPKLRVL